MDSFSQPHPPQDLEKRTDNVGLSYFRENIQKYVISLQTKTYQGQLECPEDVPILFKSKECFPKALNGGEVQNSLHFSLEMRISNAPPCSSEIAKISGLDLFFNFDSKYIRKYVEFSQTKLVLG